MELGPVIKVYTEHEYMVFIEKLLLLGDKILKIENKDGSVSVEIGYLIFTGPTLRDALIQGLRNINA